MSPVEVRIWSKTSKHYFTLRYPTHHGHSLIELLISGAKKYCSKVPPRETIESFVDIFVCGFLI